MLKSQSDRLGVLMLNAMRCIAALLLLLLILFTTGRYQALAHLELRQTSLLLLSVGVGMVVGDSLYLRSQALMGVARALPISGSYPLWTLLLAVLFLGERITWRSALGTFLVVGAVVVIATPRRGIPVVASALSAGAAKQGLLLALLASVCWATSTSVVRIALAGMDVIAASCIRLVASGLILALVAAYRGQLGSVRKATLRSIGIVALAGVIGTGLGSVLFLTAVQMAGASQAATLSATAPFWSAPLSVIFLHERVDRRVMLGIATSVAGVWLLV